LGAGVLVDASGEWVGEDGTAGSGIGCWCAGAAAGRARIRGVRIKRYSRCSWKKV